MGEDFVEVAELNGFAPGTMRCVQLRNRRVLLANVGGTIYAADELCSHEDASLCTGALQGHYVKCPLHGSRFDLQTGEPLEDPAQAPIKTYAVKVQGNAILIRLPSE